MYLDNDLNFCKREISDAEKNGCHSITITVDSPVRPVKVIIRLTKIMTLENTMQKNL